MAISRKSQMQIGFGVIILAALLLLGGIFFDDDVTVISSSKSPSNDKVDNRYLTGDELDRLNYLFYLNDTELGRQSKTTQNFPNFELGAKTEFNKVYSGNSFRLNANPFTSNRYNLDVQLSEPENVNELLLYFNPDRITGEQPLRIYANNVLISENLAKTSDIPIKVKLNPTKNSTGKVTLGFELAKPSWYSLFNWNKFDITEPEVIEEIQDNSNKIREFDFTINKEFLEEVQMNFVVSCEEIKDVSESIKITVNDFIIANKNPNCNRKTNTIVANVSTNILNSGQNRMVIETEGFYRVAYSVNQIYFNDKDTYRFTLDEFPIDIIVYGDFDKEVIDLEINNRGISLERDEIKSIIKYVKFGINEIEFKTKPIDFEEFVIEKEGYYRD